MGRLWTAFWQLPTDGAGSRIVLGCWQPRSFAWWYVCGRGDRAVRDYREAPSVTRSRLGLDRDIKLAWLDEAAAITAQRLNNSETQQALMAALEGEVLGATPQS